jgi:hypothetical protein
MKKKILVGLGAIAIAVALTFNVSIAKNSNSSGLELSTISSTATAQAEPGGLPDEVCRYVIRACFWTHNPATECVGGGCF